MRVIPEPPAVTTSKTLESDFGLDPDGVHHRARSRGCVSCEERGQEAKCPSRPQGQSRPAWWGEEGALPVSQPVEEGCSPRGLAVTEYTAGYSL